MKADLANTFSTAMSAMSTAAEVGAVLKFLRSSFQCRDYASLARETLAVLASYGMTGSVQIRGKQGAVSLGPTGPSTSLEESVLDNMASQGRLFEFSTFLSCSYEHVTLIVKNADCSDRDRYGRLKDNLALLTEGADTRVMALDDSAELAKKNASLAALIAGTRQALHGLDRRHRKQRRESNGIFLDLQTSFEHRLLTLGLTQSQEEEVVELVQNASRRALALYDEGKITATDMESLLRQLDESGR